ncbi:uncharacterized protein LOC113944876 isoform X2 [Corapipo altera]|uniref:uncharacterized protein LOC113944876 isoform X2 n=1 Tax=Corapipo altera TaxID=415028 RepID=UPI000FD68D75|nr:uncharacterized protein LOC113944876 isoform X2 [Corapipo altera]
MKFSFFRVTPAQIFSKKGLKKHTLWHPGPPVSWPRKTGLTKQLGKIKLWPSSVCTEESSPKLQKIKSDYSYYQGDRVHQCPHSQLILFVTWCVIISHLASGSGHQHPFLTDTSTKVFSRLPMSPPKHCWSSSNGHWPWAPRGPGRPHHRGARALTLLPARRRCARGEANGAVDEAAARAPQPQDSAPGAAPSAPHAAGTSPEPPAARAGTAPHPAGLSAAGPCPGGERLWTLPSPQGRETQAHPTPTDARASLPPSGLVTLPQGAHGYCLHPRARQCTGQGSCTESVSSTKRQRTYKAIFFH